MKFTLPSIKVNSDFLKPVIKDVEKHAPEILISLGIVGLIGDILLTAKIAPAADRKLKKAEFEKGEPLTKVEAVKEVGKDFIPVIILAAASTASVVCGTHGFHKRTAALAAMYTLAESSLSDYKKQVIEMVGEEKEEEITKKTEEERAEKIFTVQKSDAQVIDPYGNYQKFYDLYRGIMFYSSETAIDKAVNSLNRIINEGSSVTLNDFYYELGLDPVAFGNDVGWEGRNLIDIRYGAFRKDGIPISTINFKYNPQALI